MATLEAIPGKLDGVLLVKPKIFADSRGSFTETFHAVKYRDLGIEKEFVQDNVSVSKQHVLRGLHFQRRYPQGKLVFCVVGEIYDVAVDIRPDSATFGQWEAHRLSAENYHQLFIPAGFAHGFLVLSETATVTYKCTDIYRPDDDAGIRWDDPALAIEWPVTTPILSDKDQQLPLLDS